MAFILAYIISALNWCTLAYCILVFLMQGRIISPNNRLVYKSYAILSNVVEPILRPIRMVIKPISGIDASPMVLIVLLQVLKSTIL